MMALWKSGNDSDITRCDDTDAPPCTAIHTVPHAHAHTQQKKLSAIVAMYLSSLSFRTALERKEEDSAEFPIDMDDYVATDHVFRIERNA